MIPFFFFIDVMANSQILQSPLKKYEFDDLKFDAETLSRIERIGNKVTKSYRYFIHDNFIIQSIIHDEVDAEYKKLKNEIQILKSIDHSNIIKIENYSLPPDDYPTAKYTMPYYETDLFQMHHKFIKQHSGIFARLTLWKSYFEEVDKQRRIYCKIIHQLLNAMNYMKSKNVAHRDIKPENIMIDKKNNTILADFGWATAKSNVKSTTHSGTPELAAPEIHKCEDSECEYDPNQSDLFSLGVLVSELFEISVSKRLKDGRWIVKCIQISKAERQIQYNSLRNIDANIAMKAMVKLLLQCDPERRPTPALLLRLIQFSEFYN
eukprot:NODE_147_length_15617_cov_0.576750.p3 type:complete len:321 gc:universal NODE_147_length_15617_cov_0.576750:4769-5731(+)